MYVVGLLDGQSTSNPRRHPQPPVLQRVIAVWHSCKRRKGQLQQQNFEQFQPNRRTIINAHPILQNVKRCTQTVRQKPMKMAIKNYELK